MRHLLAASALICAPALSQAQDLGTDLAELFSPVDHVENLADTLSCTALYRSLFMVIGAQSELSEDFRDREGFMASVAGILWVADEGQVGQTPDEVFATLLPLIDGATEQFITHMEAVLRETEAPFDDVIFDQVDFCNAIVTALQRDAE
jgi:hypothetical protein